MPHIISTSRNRTAYWAEELHILLIGTRWHSKSSHWSDGSFQRRKIKADKEKRDRQVKQCAKINSPKGTVAMLGVLLKTKVTGATLSRTLS